MIKIRNGVFETNSSSTHSLCIAQNDEIEKLQRNELLINRGWHSDSYLLTKEEAIEELFSYINKYGRPEERVEVESAIKNGDEETVYRYLYEYDVAERYDSYLDSEYLEPYEEEFTTANGDRVLIFGRYGHD